MTDDCLYDFYKNSFNFDVYNLYTEKEKIFISFISKKEDKKIKIIEFQKIIIKAKI